MEQQLEGKLETAEVLLFKKREERVCWGAHDNHPASGEKGGGKIEHHGGGGPASSTWSAHYMITKIRIWSTDEDRWM